MVFAIHWHESAMDLHMLPILIPPPTSGAIRKSLKRLLVGEGWLWKRSWEILIYITWGNFLHHVSRASSHGDFSWELSSIIACPGQWVLSTIFVKTVEGVVSVVPSWDFLWSPQREGRCISSSVGLVGGQKVGCGLKGACLLQDTPGPSHGGLPAYPSISRGRS